MPKSLTASEIERTIAVWNDPRYKTRDEMAKALGIATSTFRGRMSQLRSQLVEGTKRGETRLKIEWDSNTAARDAIKAMELRLKASEQELEHVKKEAAKRQQLVELIHGFEGARFDRAPDWTSAKAKGSKGLTGIATMFFSDLHWGEVVYPEQVEGVNFYDMAEAKKRFEYTIDKSVDLLVNHIQDARYDGAVVPFGGDIFSGNIHEELSETNEQPIFPTLFAAADNISAGLRYYADMFGRVFVPWWVGNHGRLHRKPRAKNGPRDNYEWALGHLLAREFANDDRVTFQIAEAFDTHWEVYGTRFLGTHGDQFKGGSGISGIFTPLHLGQHRKTKRALATSHMFDVMLIGHFHQYIHTERFVVNGAMKGYDEYAYKSNFEFEPPRQACFVVHPDFGVTARWPVICNGYDFKHKGKTKAKLKAKSVWS